MENNLQNKITKLEKKVNDLKNELKYEEIANNTLLEEKGKQKQLLEQQLAQKEAEIVNYQNQKQVGDRIIEQLKSELNKLRAEKLQMKQELQAKDMKIQELTIQIEKMTSALEQDLTNQVEFPPKGYF
jgi:chromosome segregation ATPase